MYFERDEGEEVVMLTRNVLAKKVIIEVASAHQQTESTIKMMVNLRSLIKLP